MQQYLCSCLFGHLNKIFAVSVPLWILTEALAVCHLSSVLSVLLGVRKQLFPFCVPLLPVVSRLSGLSHGLPKL